MKVVWSRLARDDLRYIRAYIAESNPIAAAAVARAIMAAAIKLERSPSVGRPGRLPNMRELVVSNTPFVVPYRATERRVEIVGVLHGARQWPEKKSQ